MWAAIPDLPKPGLGAGCPRPLQLEVSPFEDFINGGVLRRLAGLAPVDGADKRLLNLVRETYPLAADGLQIDSVAPEDASFEGSKATVSWREPNGEPRGIHRATTRYMGRHWLIPRLNDNDDVLGPLMLWWCLLHALSQFARYHPAEWTAALDPNDAWTTVPIEQVLSLALEMVPRLVLLQLSPGAVDP